MFILFIPSIDWKLWSDQKNGSYKLGGLAPVLVNIFNV